MLKIINRLFKEKENKICAYENDKLIASIPVLKKSLFDKILRRKKEYAVYIDDKLFTTFEV